MNKKQWNGLAFFLKDKRKKNYLRIVYEFFYLWVLKKEIPWYYFKFLYRKNISNIEDYLGTKEAYKVKHCPKYHRKEYIMVMDHKLSFSLFCKENNIPSTELISYNFRTNFYLKGKLYKINDHNELEEFFNQIWMMTEKDRFFVKPISAYGGAGARILEKSRIKVGLPSLYEELVGGDFIHEHILLQHKEIAQIYSKSVNTIRFETFIDANSNVHVLSAFMRFGRGDSVVDNASSGGVYVGVNMDNGTLKEIAYEQANFGNEDYPMHPDTQFVFGGFKIPFFKEACELVKLSTEYLPDRYIGWDVAITENGPVILEANQDPGIFTSDVTYGGYLNHPIYNEILDGVKDWVPN